MDMKSILPIDTKKVFGATRIQRPLGGWAPLQVSTINQPINIDQYRGYTELVCLGWSLLLRR